VNARDAAGLLVERVRARPWGLAVVAIAGDDVEFAIDAGDDPLDEDSLFQVGSITKTMTGVLFADAVIRAEVSPDTTLQSALGIGGEAGGITVAELATHHSGLPRLPENLQHQQDPKDPYGGYTRDDLRAALASVTLGPKQYAYANFGFMTLGEVLRTVTGTPVEQLWADRLFAPLGMDRSGAPGPTDNRVPGYSGSQQTPWWTTQTPGSGGVGATVRDLGSYLHAHVSPPRSPLGQAIELATTIHAEGPPQMGYGWHRMGESWWHNGSTYGFSSFAAVHRATRTAVGMLANSGDGANLDAAGTTTLTAMIRARRATSSPRR
jgi:CubicO group peptidase (beta-lactamase class C family)